MGSFQKCLKSKLKVFSLYSSRSMAYKMAVRERNIQIKYSTNPPKRNYRVRIICEYYSCMPVHLGNYYNESHTKECKNALNCKISE